MHCRMEYTCMFLKLLFSQFHKMLHRNIPTRSVLTTQSPSNSKLVTVNELETVDTTSEQFDFLKHWESENEKWQKVCSGYKKAGLPARVTQVYVW